MSEEESADFEGEFDILHHIIILSNEDNSLRSLLSVLWIATMVGTLKRGLWGLKRLDISPLRMIQRS